MKRKKRDSAFLTILITTIIITVMGCSPSSSSEESEASLEPVDSAADLPEKFEEEVTLSLVKHISGDIEFKNGETIEDNVHTQWLRTNLTLISITCGRLVGQEIHLIRSSSSLYRQMRIYRPFYRYEAMSHRI